MLIRSFCAVLLLACTTSAAFAQSLGAFRWQMQPYCNVLTLTVTQTGGVYTLDGFDDQCGAGARASVTGTAFPNPDGTIGIGLNVVTAPGGTPLHLEVALSLATLGGPWHDSAGGNGTFAFNPSAVTGTPRPSPAAAFPAGLIVGQTSLFSDSGILAQGQEEVTGPAPYSKGTRLLWHPGKGAFRSGGIFSENDDQNMGLFSTAMGYGSTASGQFSVALGVANASGERSVALGGASATGEKSVAIGFLALATGKSAIALGEEVHASAPYSVVLGGDATSDSFTGSFVYGDGIPGVRVRSSAANQFTVRARGGTRFFSNLNMTSGVTLAPGASAWASVSDINMKENFRDLGGDDVLAKIARMPIREWNYKTQDAAIRHVGPTAQDFHAAFGLGEDPLRISTIDADGIALAGVKALALENQALKTELALLRERLARLERKQP